MKLGDPEPARRETTQYLQESWHLKALGLLMVYVGIFWYMLYMMMVYVGICWYILMVYSTFGENLTFLARI